MGLSKDKAIEQQKFGNYYILGGENFPYYSRLKEPVSNIYIRKVEF